MTQTMHLCGSCKLDLRASFTREFTLVPRGRVVEVLFVREFRCNCCLNPSRRSRRDNSVVPDGYTASGVRHREGQDGRGTFIKSIINRVKQKKDIQTCLTKMNT